MDNEQIQEKIDNLTPKDMDDTIEPGCYVENPVNLGNYYPVKSKKKKCLN